MLGIWCKSSPEYTNETEKHGENDDGCWCVHDMVDKVICSMFYFSSPSELLHSISTFRAQGIFCNHCLTDAPSD